MILNSFPKWASSASPFTILVRQMLISIHLKRPHPWNNFTLDVLDISLCPFPSPERRQTKSPLIPATSPL